MYDVLANAPYVEYATPINWNFTGDELGILHYVEGAPAAFERTVEETTEVIEYALKRVDDDAFYAYIRDATTPEIREMFETVTTGSLVAAPPIEYHHDGTVTFSLFGPAAYIQAALSLGYYEVPRTASHEDVAEELDCAPSTAAEHLRKAEATVIETVFSP